MKSMQSQYTKKSATPPTLPQHRLIRATLLAGFASIASVDAANYYWGGGTAGDWNTTTPNWSTTSGGTGSLFPNNANHVAVFKTDGGGLVDVKENIGANSLQFLANDYELFSSVTGGATVSVSGSVPIFVQSGVTGTIGAGLKVTMANESISTGVLDIEGTVTRASSGVLGIVSGATVNVNAGGVLNDTNNGAQIFVGRGSAGTLNVNGGTVNVGQNTQNRSLILATGASTYGVASLNSGAINITNAGTGHLQLGDNQSAATTATFNLNGGVLTAPFINSGTGSGVNSTFNFNGGTLRAEKDSPTFMQGLDQAYILAGGAIIDTNNRSITVGQALLHDNAFGPGSDGGLAKSGAGTLTLTGLNSYNGDTVINDGTLSIDNPYLFDLANVRINGTNSIFNLNFAGTDTIAALYFDGVPAALGTWGAPLSGADHESDFITGTGFLNVTAIPEPSTAWLVFGLAGCMAFKRRR